MVEAITIKLFSPSSSSILVTRIESERSNRHIEDAAIEEGTRLAKGTQEISQEDYETYDTEARGVDQAREHQGIVSVNAERLDRSVTNKTHIFCRLP